MKKKILILGNSAAVYSLAKNLSKDFQVFVAPGNDTLKEFVTCLDIRETAVTEILEYVMENDIDLTIPVSTEVLKTNMVELFNKNNRQIFAPTAGAAKLVFDKALSKKVFYKLRIPTPKFGIFEKQNVANDYIKNLKNPFVIKTNEPSSAVVLTSAKESKNIVDSIFMQKSPKIIIEDYIWGTPFSFYTLTDGYKALPLGSSILYKHSLEGDGGQLTSGMGACSPNYKLSIENEYFLMDNVIYPTLDYLEIEGNPYVGILGVNGILTEEGNIQLLGYQSFMQDSDCNVVLKTLDADLYSLFESCVIGFFSDEVDFIEQKDIFAASVVLKCNRKGNKENIISGLDNLNEDVEIAFYPSVNKNKYLEYEVQTGPVLAVSASAATVSAAVKKVYKEVEDIEFAGKSFRKDICRALNSILS